MFVNYNTKNPEGQRSTECKRTDSHIGTFS